MVLKCHKNHASNRPKYFADRLWCYTSIMGPFKHSQTAVIMGARRFLRVKFL
jgi:hypothetical protein